MKEIFFSGVPHYWKREREKSNDGCSCENKLHFPSAKLNRACIIFQKRGERGEIFIHISANENK